MAGLEPREQHAAAAAPRALLPALQAHAAVDGQHDAACARALSHHGPPLWPPPQVKDAAGFEPGQQLNVADMFAAGDLVDVAGTTIGKGFQGEEARRGVAGASAGPPARFAWQRGPRRVVCVGGGGGWMGG